MKKNFFLYLYCDLGIGASWSSSSRRDAFGRWIDIRIKKRRQEEFCGLCDLGKINHNHNHCHHPDNKETLHSNVPDLTPSPQDLLQLPHDPQLDQDESLGAAEKTMTNYFIRSHLVPHWSKIRWQRCHRWQQQPRLSTSRPAYIGAHILQPSGGARPFDECI